VNKLRNGKKSVRSTLPSESPKHERSTKQMEIERRKKEKGKRDRNPNVLKRKEKKKVEKVLPSSLVRHTRTTPSHPTITD